MLKSIIVVTLGAVVLGGCSSPQSKAREADEAQHDAKKTAAYADEDAKVKADAIQKRSDDENARNARDAAKKGDEARGNADRKAAEATESLAEARFTAREDAEKKLAGLDKEVADLKPKLVRWLFEADSASIIRDLTAKSDAVRRSIGDLSYTTADSLEPVKSTIARRLDDLDRAINEAKKRI
jgi:hypothetical protein